MTPDRIATRSAQGLRRVAPALATLALAACATDPLRTDPAGYLAEVPEQVAALAAPGQDLSRVQLRDGDGCFYYLHAGPVEDTMIPLRTARGNPICTEAPTTG
jgi:hypothetical protein